MAFTPYVAALSAPIALALFLTGERLAALVACLAAAALVGLVLPRAVDETASADRVLRVMTANMKLGEADPEALVRLVREQEVDVLTVQELTAPLARELRAAGLDDELRASHIAPAPGSAGGGIWTRRVSLEVREVPGALAGPLPAAGFRIPGQAQAIVYGVHPPPPTGSVATDEWEADLASIPPAIEGGPLRIIAGDFNATLDHDALRDVIDGGYHDAAEEAGVGLQPTWPNGRLFPPQVTIDHVLVDARAEVAGADVFDLPGSDHRAVLAEIVLPGAL
jgi:endonuclease/exonuclease/phosphatase (EEP) superfamily protein YafD